MAGNLPPGVSPTDLPGNEPKERPMKGECAVCGAPVAAHLPPRKDPNTPKFCDEHDQDDLRKMARREAREANERADPLTERYRRH